MKQLRLIPIVLVAIGTLFVLKSADLLGWLGSSEDTVPPTMNQAQIDPSDETAPTTDQAVADALTVADQVAALDGEDASDIDTTITGQVGGDGEGDNDGGGFGFQLSEGLAQAAARRAAALRSSRSSDSNVREVILGGEPETEMAILERLSERRAELEARDDQLEMRENLLQAAERRIEQRITELENLEREIDNSIVVKNEAEAAQMQGLVEMYQAMKPKDAAAIFDRLDMDILMLVANGMEPKRMAAVMAKMSPDMAKKLTTAMALQSIREEQRAVAPQPAATSGELPKIQGTRPIGG